MITPAAARLPAERVVAARTVVDEAAKVVVAEVVAVVAVVD